MNSFSLFPCTSICNTHFSKYPTIHHHILFALPWLSRSVAGISPWRQCLIPCHSAWHLCWGNDPETGVFKINSVFPATPSFCLRRWGLHYLVHWQRCYNTVNTQTHSSAINMNSFQMWSVLFIEWGLTIRWDTALKVERPRVRFSMVSL